MKRQRIDSSHTKNVTTNEIAYYLACGVELHPYLYEEFIDRIMEQDQKSLICALPLTRLQHYSTDVARKINTLLKTA